MTSIIRDIHTTSIDPSEEVNSPLVKAAQGVSTHHSQYHESPIITKVNSNVDTHEGLSNIGTALTYGGAVVATVGLVGGAVTSETGVGAVIGGIVAGVGEVITFVGLAIQITNDYFYPVNPKDISIDLSSETKKLELEREGRTGLYPQYSYDERFKRILGPIENERNNSSNTNSD